ncbi:hypothetical protein C900_05376 [Fulvivirga imtechensis AK7]|uniref:HTH cro/C1-type domain-containing protein n=1 Tax=Fulvivirga imtechensis AK7 TaxID=1237149 RepID=L8JK40_9BACT|nr:hypothetical protein [Fulvivirga imtechensis]ELR69180.1 hypothetical protein C900_05376 [Fulvivirga imtechensis AK7]
MNQHTWQDRLRSFIEYLGLKPTSFEGLVGLSHGSIGKALKSKSSIGTDKLEKIFSEYPDLNPTWLFKGSGEMLLSNEETVYAHVAEEFVVYMTKSQTTSDAIKELKGMAADARQAHLIGLIEQAINDLSRENVELKNKLLKLYEDKERLANKIDRLL